MLTLRFSLSAFLLMIGSGCILPRSYSLKIDPTSAGHHVVVLTGIGGASGQSGPETIQFAQSIAAQPGFSAQVVDWTRHRDFWWHTRAYLLKESHIREVAEELALEINAWRGLYPGKPLSIVGESGGAQLAALACEDLASGQLQRTMFLSAWLNADRDLAPVLNATQDKVFNYYSSADTVLRPRPGVPPKAGRVGFNNPPADVKQLSWGSLSPAERMDNQQGNHLECLAPGFSGTYLRPVLTTGVVPPGWQ